jgi:hypothetical protein
MAKQTKMSKTDILDRCIKTTEYLIVPVAGVAAIWGFDISVYVAAFAAFIIAGLNLAKLFIKD